MSRGEEMKLSNFAFPGDRPTTATIILPFPQLPARKKDTRYLERKKKKRDDSINKHIAKKYKYVTSKHDVVI